jgi:hypothetical protein
MTIFLNVCKELIERVLQKTNADSLIADNSSYKKRVTVVSETQRKMTLEFLDKKLTPFVEQSSDKENVISLKQFLDTFYSEVEKFRKSHTMKPKRLNKTLADLSLNLERSYSNLAFSDSNFLLDTKEEKEDVFNILCTHALYYLVEDIICPENNVFVKTCNTVSSFFSKSSAEIRKEKEQCLMKHLNLCKVKIEGLDKTKENYKTLRNLIVVEEINTILRENAKICVESQPIPTIPVQINPVMVAHFKVPTTKPSRGRLKIALENALEQIYELDPSLKPENNTQNLVSSFYG